MSQELPPDVKGSEEVSSFVRHSDFEIRDSKRRDVVLIPFGSAGDVLPFIWLGRLLRERGHRVTIISSAPFDDFVRATGLSFVGLGTEAEFDEIIKNPDVWSAVRGPELILELAGDLTRRQFEAIRAAVPDRRSALLIAPGTAFGARLAREKLGIPLISVNLQPICYISEYETPIMGPHLAWMSRMPRWLKRLLFRLPNPLDRRAGPRVCAACREEGVTPPRDIYFEWFHSPDGDLALFPSWFARPQPDWPPNVHQHTFPLEDLAREQRVSSELEEFIAAGPKPILFTPGSANRHGAKFFDAAVRACTIRGWRAIFATRYADQLPANLPADICAADYIPFGRVLPQCAAIVHHGGIGTTAQGLAAGLPQLVMPMAHDQPDNASRLIRLGVGRALPPRAFTPERVGETLGELTISPVVQRAALALKDQLRTDRATDRMLDWIEARARARCQ